MNSLKYKIIAGVILTLLLIIWIFYTFINTLIYGNLGSKIEIIFILITCLVAIFRKRIKSFILIVKQKYFTKQ